MARLAYMVTLERIHTPELTLHLDARGLEPAGEGAWRRGTRWGGWVGVSPYTWPVQVTLSDRDLAMRVRAPGQRLTRSEARFWDTEWELLCRAAAGQPASLRRAQERHTAALIENGVLASVSAALGGVSAMTAGAMYGQSRGLAVGGLVAGAVMGLGNALLRRGMPPRER